MTNVPKLVHFEPGLPVSEQALRADRIAIRVETQLSKVEFVWRSFETLAVSHVFQTFDWISVWHNAIGRHDGVQPRIVVGRGPSGDILFLLPFGIRRHHGVSVLEWLGGSEAEVKAGLFTRDFLRQVRKAQWSCLWRRINEELAPFDAVHLVDQPEWLDGMPNPFASSKTHRQAGERRASRLLGDWRSYCESKKPAGWKYRRVTRSLDSLGELTFEIARDSGRATDLLQKLFARNAQLCRRQGLANPLASPLTRTFHWRLARRMHPHGPVHLSALSLNGKLIGINWGLIFKGRFYYLLSVHDTVIGRLSSKKRQLNELVRWCLEEGLEHFEFGAREQGTKHGWCEARMELFSTIQGRTMKGRIAAGILGLEARLQGRAAGSKFWRRLSRDIRLLVRPPARRKA